MKTKIFNVLALLATANLLSTWSFHDGILMVIVVGGLLYLQWHDQIEEQRTAGHTELVTRLDRWQQDVKGQATPSGQPVTSVICRRVADYARPVPLSDATTPCTGCGALVAFNPESPHQDRQKICMQCYGIEPLPIT